MTIESFRLPPRTVAGPEGVAEEAPYILNLVAAEDGSDIVVAICTGGYCGGLGWATADAETTLFQSTDGGARWRRWATLSGGYSPVTMWARCCVMLADNADPAGRMGPAFMLFPGQEPVELPQGGPAWPAFPFNGKMIWMTEDGTLVDSVGNVFITAADDVRAIRPYPNGAYDPGSRRLAVDLSVDDPSGDDSDYYLGMFDEFGNLQGVFSLGGLETFVLSDLWVGEDLLLANVEFHPKLLPEVDPGHYGTIPSILDLKRRLILPIPHPFIDKAFPLPNPRNKIVATMRGPFARVVTSGSCLNVRVKPDQASLSLTCAADRVLLRDTGELVEGYGGDSWLRVVTPGGVAGWAAARFLEH
jgi:hypothetical protein